MSRVPKTIHVRHVVTAPHDYVWSCPQFSYVVSSKLFTPDIAIFVLKRDVKLNQQTNHHQNHVQGFWNQWGLELAIPITLAIGFYNSLYYCKSRD